MRPGPTIYFAVTNDLNYDRRMRRICSSLQAAGYDVRLVGRRHSDSMPVDNQSFGQVRLRCFFKKGKLFYAEFNLRLFFFLIFRRMDGICAIDLDVIVPCYLVSLIKRVPRVYDAHELFCEMKEVASRPGIYRFWKGVERKLVPRFPNGYTVNHLIAAEFSKMYGVSYSVIRNMPVRDSRFRETLKDPYILYQGAVNEGRCFEQLIPAMAGINSKLVVCGDGNFMDQARELVRKHRVEDKVEFRGMVPPEQLNDITRNARIGFTLFEKNSRSNYYSLANRFFDYMQAGVPQVCVDYPLYREIVDKHEVALLLPEVTADSVAAAVNRLLTDQALWNRLSENCLSASQVYNWQVEEKKLLDFYDCIFGKTPSYHHA